MNRDAYLWEVYERVVSIDGVLVPDQYLSHHRVWVAARTWMKARELAMAKTQRGPDNVLLMRADELFPLQREQLFIEGEELFGYVDQLGWIIISDLLGYRQHTYPRSPIFQSRFGDPHRGPAGVIEYTARGL